LSSPMSRSFSTVFSFSYLIFGPSTHSKEGFCLFCFVLGVCVCVCVCVYMCVAGYSTQDSVHGRQALHHSATSSALELIFIFWDSIALCSPVWPQTHYPPTPAFWVLGLQMCATKHGSG
jgi:hypothetical protein